MPTPSHTRALVAAGALLLTLLTPAAAHSLTSAPDATLGGPAAQLDAAQDVTTIGRGVYAALSPDGKTVVYRAGFTRSKTRIHPSDAQLMMWRNGKTKKLLTDKPMGDWETLFDLRVTNGGEFVVFTSFDKGPKGNLAFGARCYVWSRHTGKVKMFPSPATCLPIGVTTEGSFYYRVFTRTGTRTLVASLDNPAKTRPVTALTRAGDSGAEALSHDGRWYAYAKRGLFLKDLTTGTTTHAAEDAGGVRISPSGRFIVFSHARVVENPTDPWDETRWALSLYDRDTGAVTGLAQGTDSSDETFGGLGVTDTGRVTYVWNRYVGDQEMVSLVRADHGQPPVVTAQFADYDGTFALDHTGTHVTYPLPGTSRSGGGRSKTSSWSWTSNPKIGLLHVP